MFPEDFIDSKEVLGNVVRYFASFGEAIRDFTVEEFCQEDERSEMDDRRCRTGFQDNFRKENIDSLKKIFHEFNRRIAGAVEWGFSSVDGSKIQACNSKDRNFTKNKLDDRIKWLNGHTDDL